ncbi:MAG: MBL fold metallo-hydrolase [Desulfobacteraceae bacterium]
MTDIADRVFMIQGQDDMIPDAHMYVLGDPEGDDITLVDAGLVGKADYKTASLERMGIALENVSRIIMTHTHLDHIGCLPELRARMPGAGVWIHKKEAVPLESGDERTVYGMDMFRDMCRAQYGLEEGYFAVTVERKLEGGEVLELGGSDWEVLYIPGHSAGSIGLYEASRGILIPGDVVYADYAIGRFDLHGADAGALKDSLIRLAELRVDILLPGHNRAVKGLPEDYLVQTARQWAPYLA